MKKNEIKIKYVISINQFLYEIFNHYCSENEIKTEQIYNDENECITRYYTEFVFNTSNDSSFKIRISSIEKNNLNFSIYEKMLYFILINNARQSSDKNYFISMRKIREIRGLKNDSFTTYKCYENALYSLSNKNVKIIPLKCKFMNNYKTINCKMLSIYNLIMNKSRISEINYSFNNLETYFVGNRQKITTYMNPFKFIFKKSFSFQICLQLFRLIGINGNKGYETRTFSFKNMLKQIRKVEKDGTISDIDYYEYLNCLSNKQSERLNRCYDELEIILKDLVKYKVIKKYIISKNRTFKYLKDDEVKILINFIK